MRLQDITVGGKYFGFQVYFCIFNILPVFMKLLCSSINRRNEIGENDRFLFLWQATTFLSINNGYVRELVSNMTTCTISRSNIRYTSGRARVIICACQELYQMEKI